MRGVNTLNILNIAATEKGESVQGYDIRDEMMNRIIKTNNQR